MPTPMSMPALKKSAQAGLTLVELMAVILMISVIGTFMAYSLSESLEIQRVREAVERAKVIASTIQFARRSSDNIAEHNLSLGGFLRANNGSDVRDILTDLNSSQEIMDQSQQDLFNVQVTRLNVFVSFTMNDPRFQSIEFPAAARSITTDNENNFLAVRYTVMPDSARGLLAAHNLHQFINEKEEN